jgi:hypothetical protein
VKCFWQLGIVRRLGIFSEMKCKLCRKVQTLLSVSECQSESNSSSENGWLSLKGENGKDCESGFFGSFRVFL